MSLIFSFTAGLFSFFSPCIFPLIPAYVAHLTGEYLKEGRIDVQKKVLMIRSMSFILGFSVVFVLMGASASMIGQIFRDNRDLIEKISGILIIVFGLQMANILQLRFLMFEKRWETKEAKQKTIGSSFLLGLAFGSGWTPCVGLALSSILLLAGSSETMYNGVLMLWIYSLGLGIPFLVISLAITYSMKAVKKLNRLLPTLSLLNGWVLIGMGILLFTGQIQKISAWLSALTY
ncbi:cytochrome c biogenesis protein CcdA [Aneurinibacillus terranovensis]|uniref:cytochrome c biogenesis protein CcdA n=1 Tax=Aneurinibacillus terranovensis TaxID=278991 RepID=UPI0005586F0F